MNSTQNITDEQRQKLNEKLFHWVHRPSIEMRTYGDQSKDAVAYDLKITIENINKIINQGADIQARDKHGDTLLHTALEGWSSHTHPVQEGIANFQIDQGVDVNAKNKYGHTALHHALSYSSDLVEKLITKGAVVNEPNGLGETPLHGAAARNNEDLLKMLLDHGADITARNKGGETPLHKASKIFFSNSRNPAATKLLLDRGAPVNVQDAKGNTPLHCAFDGISTGDRNEIHSGILDELIKHGADIELKNAEGKTPRDLAELFNKQVATTQEYNNRFRNSTRDVIRPVDFNAIKEKVGTTKVNATEPNIEELV